MREPLDKALPLPVLQERRERVFLIFSGIFLGMMTMLNILGITRFVHVGPLILAVGVLPYPLTFLCTDFISEFYGRRRANTVVLVGLGLNFLVLGFLWAGNTLPATAYKTDLQRIVEVGQETVYADPATRKRPMLDPRTGLPLKRVVVSDQDGGSRVVEAVIMVEILDPATGQAVIDPKTGKTVKEIVDAETGSPVARESELFTRIFLSTQAAIFASMVAYLMAQLCDVWIFHFWKRLTRGKHLWLRSNGSTLISQLVDTTAVVLITFWSAVAAGELSLASVGGMIRDGYLFKLVVALLDTIPFYIGVRFLSGYLRIDPGTENEGNGLHS